MSIEKGKISGSQLMFLLTGLIQGSILTTAYIAELVKHDSWLVVISGFVVTIPIVLIYAQLAKRFRGMNLVQFNEVIYGKYIGKAVSAFYIYYFLMVLSFNLRVLGDFYVTFFMPETPLNFFLVVFPIVCAYAISKGIEVLARVTHLFVAILFFIIISTFLQLLPDMNFTNFLPVFELPFKNFLQGTHIMAVIPFGEIFIFLTFAATLNDTKYIVKNTLMGLLLGTISFLFVSVRNIAVLGNTEAILTSPSFNAVRLIDIGNVFTRVDILMGIAITLTLFIKSCLFYYAVVASLSQFLRLKSYLPLILPVGGIAVILAFTDWQSSAEVARVSPTVAPIFITPFLFIFPPLSLIIAKIRNLSKEGGTEKE